MHKIGLVMILVLAVIQTASADPGDNHERKSCLEVVIAAGAAYWKVKEYCEGVFGNCAQAVIEAGAPYWQVGNLCRQ